MSCFDRKIAVVNVMVKRRGKTASCEVQGDERKQTFDEASKKPWSTSKPRSSSCLGISMDNTHLRAMRCPVYRRRDPDPGSCMELENLTGDVKGKDTSGRTTRSKVPMRRSGADSSVVVMKWGNAHGAKGGGHPR
jgi:hypothetical protein